MIKIYTGQKGLGVFLLFIIGGFLFLSVFFWGISKVIQLFLPLLIVLSYLLIVVFVLGVLPATLLKFMRPSLGMYSLMMSHALGAATWVMSFFIVIKAFGFLGILFIFVFKYMAPIAFVGALLKGAWHIAGHLALWISFTYGMRYYSQWVLNLNSPRRGKGDIIDVDIIEA